MIFSGLNAFTKSHVLHENHANSMGSKKKSSLSSTILILENFFMHQMQDSPTPLEVT